MTKSPLRLSGRDQSDHERRYADTVQTLTVTNLRSHRGDGSHRRRVEVVPQTKKLEMVLYTP